MPGPKPKDPEHPPHDWEWVDTEYEVDDGKLWITIHWECPEDGATDQTEFYLWGSADPPSGGIGWTF